MAVVNPQIVRDRTEVPVMMYWFNPNEGTTGDYVPLPDVNSTSASPAADNVDTNYNVYRRKSTSKTAGGSNTFNVDIDAVMGNPVLLKMQKHKASGGNSHTLKEVSRGRKLRGFTLSSSKKIKVDKSNATGGDGLGEVTLTGFDVSTDFPEGVTQCDGFVIGGGTPSALFIVVDVDYESTDVNTKGFFRVVKVDLTTGLMTDDPTLAETMTGMVDHIVPDTQADIVASLDTDIRGGRTSGQVRQASLQFTESSWVERINTVNKYWDESRQP